MYIYDDGPVEDYTETFPVHREFDAPACTAAVASKVGADGFLSADQLRELEGAGWEIVSHTVNHCALDEVAVTRDVAPDDERLYVESGVHGATPNPVRVSDGESSTTVRVVGNGADDRGEYLDLAGAVGAAFDADDGVTERYTDEVIRYEFGASKAMLTDLGLSVSNFVCPYYRYGDRARELAPNHYVATANGYYGGINEVDDIALSAMNRTYFRTSYRSLEEVGAWLDKVAEGDHLGLLGGHSYYDTLPAERIRETLRMTRERDIEIKTLREALSDLGVATSSATATPSPTTSTPTYRETSVSPDPTRRETSVSPDPTHRETSVPAETPARPETTTASEVSVYPETSEPQSESSLAPDDLAEWKNAPIQSIRTFARRMADWLGVRL